MHLTARRTDWIIGLLAFVVVLLASESASMRAVEHVGDGVVIHRHVLLDDRGGIEIGDGSSVSDFANVYSHSHNIVDGRIVYLPKTIIGRA